MDIRLLIIEVFEKLGLIATAGLVGVLIPAIRNRLLGLGRPRDIWVAVVFGLLLSMWGAKMGDWWLGHHLNLRAVGIFIAAIVGGTRAGALTGLLAGFFYVFRVVPDAMPWAVVASVMDGVLAGFVAERYEKQFVGWRALRTAAAIQMASLSVTAVGIALRDGAASVSALPSLLAQLVGVAVGAALFVNVARVVLAREEHAVALAEARASRDALALQALRNRLEPHFLFNALNTLRATIRLDPERARALVSDLADLYRYLLHHPDDARLIEEVEHARAYLAIEKARLGDNRLVVRTDVDETLHELRVPALLLQPIVENAVRHGIAPKEGQGTVTIRARDLGTHIQLEVADECGGRRRSDSAPGAGVALQTLRTRLDKQYGDRASLELNPSNQGMVVTLLLPKLPSHPEAQP